ncbi:MAG: ribonuclease HII [Verrucomicrobia bacterium]|nr:MAG: ribonuclease HII [Verrucomicrobiota bacterium]
MKKRLRGFDLRQIDGRFGLIGVDEAGRGALAGPVVAGAVLADESFLRSDWSRRQAGNINDSKQLTEERREHFYERMSWLMSEHRIIFASGTGSVAEIEEHNILGATCLAMRRAIQNALQIGQIRPHPPDPLFDGPNPVPLQPGEGISDWKILVDGRPVRSLGFKHRAFVGGDARSMVIAMASIVAKVTRDHLMQSLEKEVPGYGFGRHKGYGTEMHRQALLELGPSRMHRKLFIRSTMAEAETEGQEAFEFFDS